MDRRGYDDASTESLPHVPNHEYSEEAWNSLEQIRDGFIANGTIPEARESLRPEIIDSWIRCREQGVNSDATNVTVPISDEEYDRMKEEYRAIVEAARSSMGIIEELQLDSDYIFEFITTDGVMLYSMGDMDLHDIVAEKSILDESSMGTNAHSLSMRYATPMIVLGPEHYCKVLSHLAAVATPVFDESGAVIGSLLLTQPLPEEPWSEDYFKLLLHALGLIVSIAGLLEKQLMVRDGLAARARADERMKEAIVASDKTQHVLDIAIGSSADAVLIADSSGVIRHASPEAAYLLDINMDALIGVSLGSLFQMAWPEDFMALIEQDRTGVQKKIEGRPFRIRGYGVYDGDQEDLDGFVVRIAPAEEVKETSKKRSTGDTATVTFDQILGTSKAIREAEKLAQRYAMTMENILITGESGTGKEYFAQAIHNASRPNGSFMSLNCAAIPERLIESELFGYESGAFTGADKAGKPGKIELADKGTLFLDEIGDMPLELQATLLRVLENKRVMRIGGKSYRQVDFRVLAATNRSLPRMVEEGLFREDLFYRLSILTVSIPPLRMRNGDVMFFAYHYLNECRHKAQDGPSRFTAEAERLLQNYPWPGNVRQMKNAVYSAFYATIGDEIGVNDLPTYLREDAAFYSGGIDSISLGASQTLLMEHEQSDPSPQRAERGYSRTMNRSTETESVMLPKELLRLDGLEESAIKLALMYTEGNVAQAAAILQISKATLYRKLKEYGLK